MDKNITSTVKYVGVYDRDIDLFEGQYDVPEGISYNSYVIDDEKIAVMDAVDKRAVDMWLANVDEALGGRQPDFLVVSHMEPDHAAGVMRFADKYPSARIVGNAKTFPMIAQFFGAAVPAERQEIVKEGSELSLGAHTLTFIMTPMVHWPEVMMCYEKSEKLLFSADAFGRFGEPVPDDDWACEARRYYFNIVGKYGVQVQNVLKKAADLDIQKICPLHGPVLDSDLGYYIGKYDVWSKYEPEDKGVTIAYASAHGNTAAAAEYLAEKLREKGEESVSLFDLSRDDMAEAVEDAFRYDAIVFASITYDAALFPPMESFLAHLKGKAYKNRTAAIIENGSWAPMAGKLIRAELEAMKGITILENTVTVKSALNDESRAAADALADAIRAR